MCNWIMCYYLDYEQYLKYNETDGVVVKGLIVYLRIVLTQHYHGFVSSHCSHWWREWGCGA